MQRPLGSFHQGEVLEAFRLGASEIPGAWRVLADVYDANREWAQDSNGRAEYRRKEREALARALEGAPNDGEARYRYAMLLDDRGARVRELARAVRDNPNAIEPRRWLGEDLLVSGKVEEGARPLVETAQLCSPRELNVYGPSIAVLLQNHGRAPDAAEVRARMQQARQ